MIVEVAEEAKLRIPPLMLTVPVAVSPPRYGVLEALKVCVVPEETMARGPLAEKVWVVPESPLREVIPWQVPLIEKQPALSSMPLPVNVEVAVPVLAKANLESIKPVFSMAPAEVVAWPTPSPPVT